VLICNGRAARVCGAATTIVLGATLWTGNAWAQSHVERARPLVVVAGDVDLDCVRRIAGGVAEVFPLLAPGPNAGPQGYDACNARVLELRDFDLYLADAELESPAEAIWRERLIRSNPAGQMQWIGRHPCAQGSACEHAAWRAAAIHRALLSVAPGERSALDANLSAELARLKREAASAPQLASQAISAQFAAAESAARRREP
jgi:ABC-type Zn uptake system ZnuABC Zn-binding protein ZnuA